MVFAAQIVHPVIAPPVGHQPGFGIGNLNNLAIAAARACIGATQTDG
jgi:hypothetical protein